MFICYAYQWWTFTLSPSEIHDILNSDFETDAIAVVESHMIGLLMEQDAMR